MPRFLNRASQQVSAEEALIGGVLRDGYRQILEPGERVGFDLAFVDSASGGAAFMMDSATTICDAERGMIIAQAKCRHYLRTRYLGDQAPAFTDAQAATAVENALRQKQGVADAVARAQAELPVLRAACETARKVRQDELRNAWRR